MEEIDTDYLTKEEEKFITERTHPKLYKKLLEEIKKEPYKSRIDKMKTMGYNYIMLIGPEIKEDLPNDNLMKYFDMANVLSRTLEDLIVDAFKYYSTRRVAIVELNKL